MSEQGAEYIPKAADAAVSENIKDHEVANAAITTSNTASTSSSLICIPTATRIKPPTVYSGASMTSLSRIGRLCSHSAPKPGLPTRGKYNFREGSSSRNEHRCRSNYKYTRSIGELSEMRNAISFQNSFLKGNNFR